MKLGAAYYPEQWPVERWETDVRMMREAGLSVARLAEFAWCVMEPTEGVYRFEWLDRALDLLGAAGIQVILGTPTAAPPKWLVDAHPQIHSVDRYGHVFGFGHRRYYCMANRTYRRYVESIVTRMAQRYGADDRVVGWQIDNEIGVLDTTRCYCETCRAGFQDWVRARHGTIERLNDAWGTVFSGQGLTDFGQVIVPSYRPIDLHNPGLGLDFARFASDTAIDFVGFQREVLRRNGARQVISHNLMGGEFTQVDYYRMAEHSDIVFLDIYANTRGGGSDPSRNAFDLDVTRSLKRRSFWIVEHQSGTPGGPVLWKTPAPGDLRRWTWQSLARGADTVVYFRWRTALSGLEQFWHGILGHDGGPNRRYDEVCGTAAEVARLDVVMGEGVDRPEVAIVRDYENDWVFEIQPQAPGYAHNTHLRRYYTALYRWNVPVDIVPPLSDLSGYKLVVYPNAAVATQRHADWLSGAVRGGATLVLDYRAGLKDPHNRIPATPLPGVYRDLVGAEVEDYGVLEAGEMRLRHATGLHPTHTWFDLLRLRGARSVATYADGWQAGRAAVTVNRVGEGSVWYLGTDPDADLFDRLLDEILTGSGVASLLGVRMDGVEVARRPGRNGDLYFLINHGATDRWVEVPGRWWCVLAAQPAEDRVRIAANDVVVLTRERNGGT